MGVLRGEATGRLRLCRVGSSGSRLCCGKRPLKVFRVVTASRKRFLRAKAIELSTLCESFWVSTKSGKGQGT